MPTLSSTTPDPVESPPAKKGGQAAKDVRMGFRLNREAKERIEKAALFLGQSLNDFAVATLVRESKEVLARHGTMALSEHDRDLFLELLDNPPEPAPRLQQTLSVYDRAAHTEGERTVLNFSLCAAIGKAP